MATKVKSLKKHEAPVGFYKKIAFLFVALTGILVLLAAYYILGKAEIAIKLAKEPISVDFIADLTAGGTGAPLATVPGSVSINGQLSEVTVSGSKEYQASGKKMVERSVGGIITIFNNYSKDQPLVATTRFLSPDGILFRLKDSVTVPAGGKVEAEVYADPPTDAAAKLGPTKFKIPGLWEGLQDKIYGESFKSMHGGKEEVGFLTQTDLDEAYEDLTRVLSNQVIDNLKKEMKSSGEIVGKVVIKEINEKRSSLAVNEEGEKFEVRLAMKVVGIAFYRRDIEGLAATQLEQKIPPGKELVGVDYNGLTFIVEKYDLVNREANIMIHLDGDMSLRSDNSIFETDKFIGLNKDQIIQYLSTYPEIERITIKFSPFCVTKVLQMKSNVKVFIQKN